MNKTTLIGRVGNDATAKEINGKTVHNFSVAVSKKVNGNEQTTWFDCAIWEKPNVATYIKKGTHVYLEGEVKADAYLKDGEAKSVLRLTVFQIQLLGGGNKDAAIEQQPQPTEQPTQPNIPPVSVPPDIDSLPF